jgi:hypothetical protein
MDFICRLAMICLIGGELEDRAQDGGHGPVVPVGLVVEDEVLELASFDGHEDRTMGGGDGGDQAPFTRAEGQDVPGTGADTHAAAQAEVRLEFRLLAFGLARISGGDEAHGLHGAGLHALSAAVAVFSIHHLGQEVGGGDGAEDRETLGGQQSFATAAAAVADEGDLLPDVLAELDEIVAQGLLQQFRAAAAAVNGLRGSSATRAASSFVNSNWRILKSSSVGGAPWGSRLSRSERLL